MRRVFIIRKDLHLTSGKLAAMVSHCAEAYWTRLISENSIRTDIGYNVKFDVSKNTMEDYIRGIFTKTICEARNLNQLNKAKTIADELGLVENVDYGFVDEDGNGRCRVGIWFKPLEDDIAHAISKKFPLYRD